MECHKCEHQAAVQAGTFRDLAFEETPCSKCQLKETSLYTINFDEGRADRKGAVCEDVPFPEDVDAEGGVPADEEDEVEAATTASVAAFVPTPEPVVTEGPATEVPVAPVTVLADALAGLLALPAHTQRLVKGRLRGLRYKEIAAAEGISTAAVEMRLKRAMKTWPALEGLFCVKSAKQVRRKAHRRVATAEGVGVVRG